MERISPMPTVPTANVSTVTTLPALAVVLLLPVLVPNLPGKAMGEQSLLLKYCLKEFNTLTRLVCFDCLFFCVGRVTFRYCDDGNNNGGCDWVCVFPPDNVLIRFSLSPSILIVRIICSFVGRRRLLWR